MAQTSLVEAAIDAGARLVDKLAQTELDPESALWLYRPESGDWVLVLGSSAVPIEGRRTGYTAIAALLRSNEFYPLRLDDVVLSDNDDALLQLLRTAMKTGAGLSRTRFSRNRIGNSFIEDALIYRLQDSRVHQAN